MLKSNSATRKSYLKDTKILNKELTRFHSIPRKDSGTHLWLQSSLIKVSYPLTLITFCAGSTLQLLATSNAGGQAGDGLTVGNVGSDMKWKCSRNEAHQPPETDSPELSCCRGFRGVAYYVV